MVKASRVPIFTSSDNLSMGKKAGRKATMPPTTRFEIQGVRNFGWITEAHGQSKPSLDME